MDNAFTVLLSEITPDTRVGRLLSRWPEASPVFRRRKMACVGCYISEFDTLQDVAHNYHLDIKEFINEVINAIAQTQSAAPDPMVAQKGNRMEKEYHQIENLNSLIEQAPGDSIVSRLVHRDEHTKVFLFVFAPGQELSEHTAAVPAIIHILEGQCSVTLGKDRYQAGPGMWVSMPANLPHSILAETPVRMLLTMIQRPGQE